MKKSFSTVNYKIEPKGKKFVITSWQKKRATEINQMEQ